jgi:chemotaxis protein methyltransferase CheR
VEPGGLESQRTDISTKLFHRFRDVIYEQAGIWLCDGKQALLCARIGKRMRALGVQSYAEYFRLVQKDKTGQETVQLVDAISTNVTGFRREASHFDFAIGKVVSWAERGQREFRFWSAACATGEEPYSLAMALLEEPRCRGGNLRILATDISTRALAHCREGVYREDRLEPLGRHKRLRYFTRAGSWRTGEPQFRIGDEPRRLISFHRHNLSRVPYPMRGPFDIIFCRNVMIYFDMQMRVKVLKEMFRLVKPGGYLMVGHAESLTGLVSDFKTERPSIYVRP